MNLGDPELEIIDPTPNVHTLFIHFDQMFFWTKLASRAVVRWSKRMYSCAGICSYEGHGGLCDIALSEPLLKLRPRKDLVETLLHEMIHAFLFVTCRDQDRDGHGPNFKSHMHRINNAAGLNISIYHDFHDEVQLYQTHWWRCNGPCQRRKPYFGIVRRTMNKPPGPTDYWWKNHVRNCGGTYVKIREPEKKEKKVKSVKPNADITKYINNNNKEKTANNNVPKVQKPILKDSNSIPAKTVGKVNGGKTGIATKNEGTFSSPVSSPPVLFSGKGQKIDSAITKVKSTDVVETVRNVWANKQLPTTFTTPPNNHKINQLVKRKSVNVISSVTNPNKHKAGTISSDSPPTKIKKIDDYFKTTATSVLKDVYGQDFKITQPNNDQKLVAVTTNVNLVDCPVCSSKVNSAEINRHLDECLNKEVIEKLSKDNVQVTYHPMITSQNVDMKKDIIISPTVPNFQGMNPVSSKQISDNGFDHLLKGKNLVSSKPIKIYDFKHFLYTNDEILNMFPIPKECPELNTALIKTEDTIKEETDSLDSNQVFDSNDINKVKSIVKKINYDKHIRKSDNFIIPKEEKKDNVDVGYLPSFLDDLACEIKNPKVKIEPGTSKDLVSQVTNKCACCSNIFTKSIEEHLDECLAFFANNRTAPEETASTSFANHTIVIDDDDDIFDETLTLNATGTKTPCPCCLKMIEEVEMNDHLDQCLS